MVVRTTTRRVCHRVRLQNRAAQTLLFFSLLSFVVLPATFESAKNPQGNRDVVNYHGDVLPPGPVNHQVCPLRRTRLSCPSSLLPAALYHHRPQHATMGRARVDTRAARGPMSFDIQAARRNLFVRARVDARHTYRNRRDSDAITFFVGPEFCSGERATFPTCGLLD